MRGMAIVAVALLLCSSVATAQFSHPPYTGGNLITLDGTVLNLDGIQIDNAVPASEGVFAGMRIGADFDVTKAFACVGGTTHGSTCTTGPDTCIGSGGVCTTDSQFVLSMHAAVMRTDTDSTVASATDITFAAGSTLNFDDAVPLNFGTTADTAFTYDGANNWLEVSGADVQFLDNVGLAFGSSSDTVFTHDGTDLEISGTDVQFLDEVGLEFGSGADLKFEFANATTTLNVTGTGRVQFGNAFSTIALGFDDGKFLSFGTNDDAKLEYDEAGSNTLEYTGKRFRFLNSGATNGVSLTDQVYLTFGTGDDGLIRYNNSANVVSREGAALWQFNNDTQVADGKKITFGFGTDGTILAPNPSGLITISNISGSGWNFVDELIIPYAALASIELDNDGSIGVDSDSDFLVFKSNSAKLPARTCWSHNVGSSITTNDANAVGFGHNNGGQTTPTFRDAVKSTYPMDVTITGMACGMYNDVGNAYVVEYRIYTGGVETSCSAGADGGIAACTTWTGYTAAGEVNCKVTGTTAKNEWRCSDTGSISVAAGTPWHVRSIYTTQARTYWNCTVMICADEIW